MTEEVLTRQGIRDLGNGRWLFCDGPEWTLEVHVSYQGTSYMEREASTVRDLWLPAGHATSPWEFRFSLQDFLQQFHSIPTRWGKWYEPLTEEIIDSSAQWQERFFVASTLMPTHTYNEATIVAGSLRCLVISNEISQVRSHWTIRQCPDEKQHHYHLTDVERYPRGQDSGILPMIDVWKLASDALLPDSVPQNREVLPQMLKRTIQMAQRLLYRGRPTDWPALFYVLCILLLVHGNLIGAMWTDAIDEAACETKEALQELCHTFHHITDNMQPLTSELDLERYAALVDDNELAVDHYRRLHHMWLANSEFARSLRGVTTQGSK